MYREQIKELKRLTALACSRADLTQGGNGNASVKFDKEIMGIKAGEHMLSDILTQDAISIVKYKDLNSFFRHLNDWSGDVEKASFSKVKLATLEIDGLKKYKPSIEVGFHSILKKYVLHTHSIYSGLLCSATAGEELAKEIFKSADYSFLWLPYSKIGVSLTRELNDLINKQDCYPEIIFMQNYGLVINSDDIERVIYLSEDINERIREHFKLEKDELIKVCLTKIDGGYKSNTKIIKDFLKATPLKLDFLQQRALSPDQIIYLNYTLFKNPEKMEILGEDVIYHTTEKEARILEENLAAYMFILKNLKNLNLKINILKMKDVEIINKWAEARASKSIN